MGVDSTGGAGEMSSESKLDDDDEMIMSESESEAGSAFEGSVAALIDFASWGYHGTGRSMYGISAPDSTIKMSPSLTVSLPRPRHPFKVRNNPRCSHKLMVVARNSCASPFFAQTWSCSSNPG